MANGIHCTRSRIYGLEVDAPYALGQPGSPSTPPDVVFRVDALEVPIDEVAPPGQVIAQHPHDKPNVWLRQLGDGDFLYRFSGLLEVEISADWSRMSGRVAGDRGLALLPVLLAGQILSSLLLVRGELVLHASAVERDGKATAIVGPSGAGKSTLAAMCCRSGARLVTDDVLRVDLAAGSPRCFRGAHHLRLRPTSKLLAGNETGQETEMSADGRHLVEPAITAFDQLPVERIVMPRLQPPDHPLSDERLDGRSALFALLAAPRVLGWQDAASQAHHFEALTALVEATPVHVLDIPWGVDSGGNRMGRIVDTIFGDG